MADRVGHLPAEPGAREAARDAARPARDRDGAAGRGDDPPALPALGAADRAGPDPRRRDRGRDDPDHERGGGHLPDRPRTSRSRRPARSPTRSSAAARSRTSASRAASRSRRAPTRPRSARRRRPATRSTSASTSRSRTCCSRSTSTARRPAAPASIPRIRRFAGRSRSPRRRRGWLEAEVVEDLTGGFNYGAGKVTIQLPDRHTAVPIAGHRGYWVCCRLDTKTRSGASASASYTHPPEIHPITAAPIGAIIPAAHSARETGEVIGTSDGTPGQIFELRYYPILDPTPGGVPRGARPGHGHLGEVGAGRVVRREQADRHALRPERRRRPGRARPGDPHAGRELAPVRRRARRRARRSASPATATAAAATATSPRARSAC